MSACLLFGHDWKLQAGTAQFKGAEFLVCNRCGKTIPASEAPQQRVEIQKIFHRGHTNG